MDTSASKRDAGLSDIMRRPVWNEMSFPEGFFLWRCYWWSSVDLRISQLSCSFFSFSSVRYLSLPSVIHLLLLPFFHSSVVNPQHPHPLTQPHPPLRLLSLFYSYFFSCTHPPWFNLTLFLSLWFTLEECQGSPFSLRKSELGMPAFSSIACSRRG